MTVTIRSFLSLAEAYCKVFQEKGLPIRFEAAKEQQYISATVERYERYRKNYMKANVRFLDRHKVAAILVVQGLASGIIRSEVKPSDEEIDIGPQKVLLMCAFDYIIAQTNRILVQKDSVLSQLDEFIFPQAWACPTAYIDILSRNLYYAEKDFMLNEMDLAEKFFLLEYICLLQLPSADARKYFAVLQEYQAPFPQKE